MPHSRKGMSLVEVVVALVIISVISASALSMIMMSVNVEADAVRSVEVAESVDNAIACFRFAETPAEFLDALQKTAPYEQDPENPDYFLPEYDSGDHLHPSKTGYERMAREIPAELLK